MQLTPKLASAKSSNGKTLIWWTGNTGLPSGHDNFYTPTTWEPTQCKQPSTTP